MYIPVKRWRGYHRALKRGKPWAVKLSKMSSFNRLFTWIYGNRLEELIPSQNKLMSMINFTPKGSSGNLYHQPVILGFGDSGVTFANVEKKEEEK